MDEHGKDQADLADEGPASVVAQELINRCNSLLSELERFSQLLEDRNKPPVFGHRTFVQDVNAEKRFIERLLAKAKKAEFEVADTDLPKAGSKIKHQLSSTNVTSYEAQWTAVKQCHGLVALRQTFWRNPKAQKTQIRDLSPSSRIKAHVKKTQDGVLVDAVVDNGAEWLKVSAVSEKQLLFQMARQGWRNDSDSDTEDDIGTPAGYDSDDEDEVAIVKLAHHLAQAAKANRHNYRHPRVRLVLPKIEQGRVKEIDGLLNKIRATCIVLECANDMQPVPSPTTAFSNLLINEFRDLSAILNIDCTLLVALASDISHAKVEIQDWYPTAVQAQIRDEQRESLMPNTLYPAMGSRPLVCTREAAQRMREIVATIGTESEVARAAILLSTDPAKSRKQLIDELQEHSIYDVPQDLQLPIRIVDTDGEGEGEGKALPAVAAAVAPHLTDINRSIFMFGWKAGYTTLSSNGTVAKQIATLVEQNRTCDEEVGPDIWVCPVARSLVAKKGRRHQ